MFQRKVQSLANLNISKINWSGVVIVVSFYLTQVYHRADERGYLLDHFSFDEGVDWG